LDLLFLCFDNFLEFFKIPDVKLIAQFQLKQDAQFKGGCNWHKTKAP